MSAPPYMKLYVGDYLGDTHHLGALEHGAYLMLLMSMWRAGGSLPAADANLCRLAKCTPEEWGQIKGAVLSFFRVSRGKITHKRVTEEMAKYEDVSRKRSEAVKARAKKKLNENSAQAASNDTGLITKPEPEPEPERKIESSGVVRLVTAADAPPSAPPRRGSRLPDDWRPTVDGLVYAARHGFDGSSVERLAERFRNYWHAKAGADAAKLDWHKTWCNWVSTEAERRPQQIGRLTPSQLAARSNIQ